MADEKPPPEFMSALGTEYFVLQSTASSTIGESGSRVSIYLSSLASGLVATGFASSSSRAFASLAFIVLPTVFILGWFTIVRLIDTSVANLVSLRRMDLIRPYYAALAPFAPPYFAAASAPASDHAVRYGRWSFLFTMASMVIVVNCVVGGATIALLCDLAFKVPLPAAAGIGVAAGLVMLALSLLYEHRRLTPPRPQLVRRDRHDRRPPRNHLAAGVGPLPENQPEWKSLSPGSKLQAVGRWVGVRPTAAVQRDNPIRDRALERD